MSYSWCLLKAVVCAVVGQFFWFSIGYNMKVAAWYCLTLTSKFLILCIFFQKAVKCSKHLVFSLTNVYQFSWEILKVNSKWTSHALSYCLKVYSSNPFRPKPFITFSSWVRARKLRKQGTYIKWLWLAATHLYKRGLVLSTSKRFSFAWFMVSQSFWFSSTADLSKSPFTVIGRRKEGRVSFRILED